MDTTFDFDDVRARPSTDLSIAADLVRAARVPAQCEPARRRTLSFIDEHDHALHRSCALGHLTGSALVVDATGECLLVMFHRKLQKWLQPGGHADGDANLAGVALRESLEETGIDGLVVSTTAIDIDIHQVAPPGEPAHLHYDTRFLVIAPEGAIERRNHESEELRWVLPSELAALGADESLTRLAASGMSRFSHVAASQPTGA